MIISHRKRFIFVHTYKVAGTSVRAALKPYADVMYRKYTPRRVLYVLGLLDSIGEHATAREIRENVGPEVFDRYFKFAFVRNPWDWQVSLYHYIRSHPLHPQYRQVKALNGFAEYVEWRIANDKVLQRDFVADGDGRLLVDYVGRFENLDADFASVCRHLGIPATPLPHKMTSSHRDYTEYYDERTRRLVTEHYRQDIDLFGYRFGEDASTDAAAAVGG